MAYIIFLLGAALGIGGGYALYLGFDDLTTERGLALTMAGTVGLSVGIAVIGISFTIITLRALGKKLDLLNASLASAAPFPATQSDAMMLDAVEQAIVEHASSTSPAAEKNKTSMPSTAILMAGAGLTGAGLAAAATLAESEADTDASRPARQSEAEAVSPGNAAEAKFSESHADISRLIEELSGEEPVPAVTPERVNPDFSDSKVPAPVLHEAFGFEAELLRELSEPGSLRSGEIDEAVIAELSAATDGAMTHTVGRKSPSSCLIQACLARFMTGKPTLAKRTRRKLPSRTSMNMNDWRGRNSSSMTKSRIKPKNSGILDRTHEHLEEGDAQHHQDDGAGQNGAADHAYGDDAHAR